MMRLRLKHKGSLAAFVFRESQVDRYIKQRERGFNGTYKQFKNSKRVVTRGSAKRHRVLVPRVRNRQFVRFPR